MKTIKQSGNKQSFKTGSQRDTQTGKPRPDLIPPFAIMKLAMHYGNGAIHYNDRNWEKGQDITRYYASLLRHIIYWACGMEDEPHLTAAIWNLVAIDFTLDMIRHGQLPAELDDRPFYMQPNNPIGKELAEQIEENIKALLGLNKEEGVVEEQPEDCQTQTFPYENESLEESFNDLKTVVEDLIKKNKELLEEKENLQNRLIEALEGVERLKCQMNKR